MVFKICIESKTKNYTHTGTHNFFKKSTLIYNWYEDEDDGETYFFHTPLDNNILKYIIDYLRVTNPTKEWFIQYFTSHTKSENIKIINGADYLNIPELLDNGVEYIANLITTSDNITTLFNIEDKNIKV